MESQCCIGKIIGEECHKQVYSAVSKDLIPFHDFSAEEQLLLSMRVPATVLTSVCKYHAMKFLQKYHHLFGRTCCDPMKVHKKTIFKGLREISAEHVTKENCYSLKLVPGKSLCPTCYSKLFVVTTTKCFDDTACSTSDTCAAEEYAPTADSLQQVDSVCNILGVSPAAKISKLSHGRRHSAAKAKFAKLSETIRKKLQFSFDDDIVVPPIEQDQQSPSSLDYAHLIQELKKKCAVATKDEKIKIISLLPMSWSRKQIAIEMNVSERLVKLSRKLVREQGIFPELAKKIGVRISEETVRKVLDFYDDDEYSRMCPGKKDFVSVKIDGAKVHRQKRLMLCNLNELYVQFKNKHPECDVHRSKFCEIRPKWCILAGASGTHTVCVCKYHQNVKLMIDGAKLNVNHKDLLEMMVCDINNYKCMMNECDQCPGQDALSEIFSESDQEPDMIPDNIYFKQWVTVDRSEMLTLVKSRDEFFETLGEKLQELKAHHYISKVQSQFLKEKKASLSASECVVLADFAENFSFVIQDEIQSHHWVNQQATVHPFVYYYYQEDQLKHHSLCVISDHLKHDSVTVHTFQMHLINHIKETVPEVQKIIYFSDGASSQYKNKKNFSNICFHKSDFGLECEWHFFATSHGKNACDGVGGTTKREATKASLQRPSNNQILTPNDLFEYCKQNIKGITYFYVSSSEIKEHAEQLQNRFNSCQQIVGTRGYHRYKPLSESKLRCYVTSVSQYYTDVQVTSNPSLSLTINVRDIVACVYDGCWWLGEVDDVSIQNKDVHVVFYNPSGPSTSFRKNEKDSTWVPLTNILRRLTPTELTTSTGRTHNIMPQLCEEISQLLLDHKN